MIRIRASKQRLALIADLLVIAAALTLFNIVEYGFTPWIAALSLLAAYSYIAFYSVALIRVVPGIRIRLTVEFGFVIFYYLLFFWPYQQELLGIGMHYYDSYFFQDGYADGANKAMLLAVAGLAAFHLGNTIAPVAQPTRNVPREPTNAYLHFDLALATIMPAFFATFIYLGLSPDDLGRYQRDDSMELASPVVNGLYLLTIMLCLIGISRLVSHLYFGRRPALRHWIILGSTGFWMLFMLIGGDRNNFLVVALGAVGGVAAFIREIRLPVLVAAVVPALIVYNTVEIYRQASDRSLAGLEEAYFAANDREADASSFALTTLTVRATFDIAPKPQPYAWGYYKLIGFGGIVPLVRGVLIGKNSGFTDTSQVLAYYIIGPEATWSLGSNPLSDLYFDFGQIGVVLGFALFGYVAAAVRNFIARKGPSSPRMFLYIVTLAMMSEVPRYTVDFPVRIVVWGYLIFWLYARINPAARLAKRAERLKPRPASVNGRYPPLRGEPPAEQLSTVGPS